MSKIRHILAFVLVALQSFGATYYCDPVNGATANDGSSAHPWRTFGEAMAVPKTLSAGDIIYLRRGYHGEFTLSGINADYVTVIAEPGHTPTMKLTLMNAQYWHFKNITFLKGVAIDTDANEGSPNNTFEGCYLPNGGFSIFCTNIKILNNHVLNGGIHYNYHSHNGLARGNVIEDFYGDAFNMKASFCTLEYNVVLDSHKVDANHNDCLQGWGSKGNVIRGNIFAVYTDPTRADISDGVTSAEGVSITQGIGCFDGTFDSWVIENNVLFIDHPIGIWILGAKNCTIKNNTVVRCGEKPWSTSRLPNISIQSKKPTPNGTPSTGNVVINNLAEAYELTDAGNAGVSLGVNSNNVIVAKSAFTSTFLAWAKKDLRLKAGSNPIDKGTSNHSPPVLDADQNLRPTGLTWDAGGYEYGAYTVADTTAPSVPTQVVATVIAGYGVDLSWPPSTDNRAVAGYDVYTNGVKVGRVRSGCNYMHVSANTGASYTLKAFDFSGNFSAASVSVGGTPPLPDTIPPTIPGNVVAIPLSTSSIRVSWSPSTDNLAVTGYDIYYTNGVLLASTALTNYTDTGLSPSATYAYLVRARDFAGNVSSSSAIAIATTLTPDAEPPSVPTGLVATPVSGSAIALAWKPSTDNRSVAGYDIYRGSELVARSSVTNYLDTGLAVLTAYTYKIRSYDAEGNASVFSTNVTATTLDLPPLLVSEPFEYVSEDNLNGKNGGTGWEGAWNVGYNTSFPALIKAGSLSVSPVQATSGNKLQFWTKGNGTTYQNLDRSFDLMIADEGQTLWFAMTFGLANSKNLATWSFAGLSTVPECTNSATLFETVANATPTPFKFGATTLFTGDTNYTPHLVLVKIVFSGDENPETFTAYVDPDLTAEVSTWAAKGVRSLYANNGLTGFTYRGGRSSTATTNCDYYIDELRIAKTCYDAVGAVTPGGDTEPPAIPAHPLATALSSSAIRLTWDASSDNVGVTGYDIFRGGVLLATTLATVYTNTGLSASTLYTYTVKAKDAAGNVSSASSAVSATTLAEEKPLLLAEESFNYATGNLVNLNGGTGWAGAWTTESHYDTEAGAYSVSEGVLTNCSGLIATGHYGSFLAGGTGTYYPSAQRLLATPLTDDGKIYWLAFQLQTPVYHKDSSITLLGTSVPFVKLKTDVIGMNFQFLGGTFHSPGDTATHLFVIKIQMSGDANPESASLYYDPNVNADPATWSALRTGTFTMTDGTLTGFRTDSARAGNTGYRFNIDEIRLATTWQAAVGKKKTGTILLVM